MRKIAIFLSAVLLLCTAAVIYPAAQRGANDGIAPRRKTMPCVAADKKDRQETEVENKKGKAEAKSDNTDRATKSDNTDRVTKSDNTDRATENGNSGSTTENSEKDSKKAEKDVIKWVDFTPTTAALKEAATLDIEAHTKGETLPWIDLLSYYATRKGGSFSGYRGGDLAAIRDKAQTEKKSISQLGNALENAKTFRYYQSAYTAVLGGMLGDYYDANGVTQYGICAFSPIARDYSYSDYDDFGSSRSYGYKRRHLGHDMLGSIGTPIIAMESGYVENCGWNQYGGWRIGIRSFDQKRFYYYAHLRKDHPYNDIYEGKIVQAGDVIGYLGMTGYSAKENVNNINVPHLHVGMELIFAPEQKDAYCQIWIDVKQLTDFLAPYRAQVVKNEASGEYENAAPIIIPSVPD